MTTQDVDRKATAPSPTGSPSLDEVLERPNGLVRLVDKLSRRGSVTRRGFFVGAAVAGSALATNPKAYALMPQTAYATICGPANTASSGWSIFCATVNKGLNACPSGSFTAGWWKAADSSWCGGGYRYIVDCNAKCTKCTSGCSDHICDSKCWNCSCTTGSTATCDQRRSCCNAFRYGQCNTQVKCSGGVHCRVVSCVAPYKWTSCSTTSFRSDSTAEHSSSYLPQWGKMEKLYTVMGGHKVVPQGVHGPDPHGGRWSGALRRLPGRPHLVDEHDARGRRVDLRRQPVRRPRRCRPARLPRRPPGSTGSGTAGGSMSSRRAASSTAPRRPPRP